MTTLSKINNFFAEFSRFPEVYLKRNKINFIERKSKISLQDSIMYRFRYMFEDKTNTFQSITSLINYNNATVHKDHKYFTRTGIYKKEKKLFSNLYKELFTKTKNFYNKLFGLDSSIIVIDGVYSNTNINKNGKVETAMSLGFYDNVNCIPINIHFSGEGKKNDECITLKKYISDNIEQFRKKLIICDRAYYCYEFFNFLVENNINFIIRLRDKAFDTEPTKHAKHYEDFMKILNNKNIRVITEIFKTEKKVVDETNNIVLIKQETIIKTMTNLNKEDFDDAKILKFYKSRWDIEEFYKQLKHNFKFQNMQEHKTESYAKNINNSLTLTLIKQLLLKCYETINEFKNKEIVSKKGNNSIKIKKSINENLIFAGIKDVLLKNIIYNELDQNKLKIFFKTYINIQYSREDRHFERKSKRPFTKWYVKKYHDIYKIKKKYLEEEIKKYFLQKNNEDSVKLKLERKEINKEYKKIKQKIKENIENAKIKVNIEKK